ncbi:MAG: hypothetical protein K8I27_00205 [Planctomycetes bacterium]|nr:hypothetical protein [Planctomycetota bacterium]
MKAGYLLCLLAGAAFCGPVFAQEEDDIDQYFSGIDTGKDDKISVDEMKAAAYADLEADAGTRDKLIAWAPHVIDFVLADADDDRVVTRAEFRAYITAAQNGEPLKFSTKDWDFYQKDYLDPYISETMKAADKDGDKALTKEEYNTLSDATPDEFAEVDTNGDGKLTGDEYKQVIKKYLNDYYEVEGTGDGQNEELKKRFAGFDADGDGKISAAEWKASTTKPDSAKADWWGLYLALLVIDTNDDLGVDLSEFASFAADQEKGVKPKLLPSDRTGFEDLVWKETDTDKNGTLSRAEYVAAAPEGGAKIYGDEYDGMDADKDGEVTRDELWQSFKVHLTDYEIVKEKAGDVGDNAADPVWDLYKKVGRTWTHKIVSVFGAHETVSWSKYEVLKVNADHAVVRVTTLDENQQPVEGVEPMETKISFKSATGGEPGDAPKTIDLGEKTITVEAGEFEAKGTEITVEAAGTKSTTTSWTHKKFLALIVKSESKSAGGSSTMELVAFSE